MAKTNVNPNRTAILLVLAVCMVFSLSVGAGDTETSSPLTEGVRNPPEEGQTMPLLYAYLWTTAGVLISFILPPLLRAAGVASKSYPTASVSSFLPRIKAFLTSRYIAVTILSLVVSLLVVALLQDKLDTWNMALISGLGWQSILARTLAPGT